MTKVWMISYESRNDKKLRHWADPKQEPDEVVDEVPITHFTTATEAQEVVVRQLRSTKSYKLRWRYEPEQDGYLTLDRWDGTVYCVYSWDPNDPDDKRELPLTEGNHRRVQ